MGMHSFNSHLVWKLSECVPAHGKQAHWGSRMNFIPSHNIQSPNHYPHHCNLTFKIRSCVLTALRQSFHMKGQRKCQLFCHYYIPFSPHGERLSTNPCSYFSLLKSKNSLPSCGSAIRELLLNG